MSDPSFIMIDDELLVSLSGDLDDRDFLSMQRRLAEAVADTDTRGILLDISGMTILDSFLARALARTVHMLRLMGAQAVVVGVTPAVAITLVDLGLDFKGMPTALNAAAGIRLLRHIREEDAQPSR